MPGMYVFRDDSYDDDDQEGERLYNREKEKERQTEGKRETEREWGRNVVEGGASWMEKREGNPEEAAESGKGE